MTPPALGRGGRPAAPGTYIILKPFLEKGFQKPRSRSCRNPRPTSPRGRRDPVGPCGGESPAAPGTYILKPFREKDFKNYAPAAAGSRAPPLPEVEKHRTGRYFSEDQDLALIMEAFISDTEIRQLLNHAFIRIQCNHHDASRHADQEVHHACERCANRGANSQAPVARAKYTTQATSGRLCQ